MQALVKEKPGPGAALKEMPVPQAGPGELLVRVKATAICGTDVHIYEWTKYAQERIKTPMVFGHEFAGEVVSVGAGVTSFRPGDHVAGETHIPCGHCEMCLTGREHICRDMKILGVHVPGIFSEFAVIPETIAWKLPEHVPYEAGAVYEPMGVAVHAVFAGDVAAKTVLVTGSGPIGLAAIGVAKALGAARVIATDRSPRRLELAREWGADETVDVSTGGADVVSRVAELTGKEGVDVVIEASGAPPAIRDGFAALRRGGRVVLFGLPSDEVRLDLVNQVVYKEATIKGITGRVMWATWYQLTRLVDSGAVAPERLVTHRHPLSEYERAFEDAKGGQAAKVILYPGR